MRSLKLGLLALAVVSAAACSRATGGGGVRISQTPQTPEILAKLEAGRQANPNSASAARALGISYFKSGRFNDAKSTLEAARRLDPNDGTTALYLGLTHESLDDIAGAREAYTRYLTTGKTKSVRNQLQGRIVFLNRRELELAARRSVANETELASQPGSPTTIAVLPMTFVGTDTNFAPLERGLAELIVTDLGRIRRLTIVERDRLQALVEELQRTQGDRFDSTTQLRTGRIIRAGRIVQGTIQQNGASGLTLNASIVDVPTTQVLRTARASDDVEQLFAMEKRLVMDILDGLGVQLTAQERGLIEQRPTRSLAAFLSYSRGLQEQDRGNFDRATQFYNQAVRIDPGFSGAAARGAQTQSAVQGATVTTASLESNLQGTSEGAVVAAAEQGNSSSSGGLSTQGTLTNTTESLNPSATNQATTSGQTSSGQGQQTNQGPTPPPQQAPPSTQPTNPTRPPTGVIVIIIRPPSE